MRDEELLDPFPSFLDHVVQHVDDVVVFSIVLLGDLVDGVLELLFVPDDVGDLHVDIIRVVDLHVDIPLSSFLSSVVALSDFYIPFVFRPQ